jgi:virulence-associated protein VapD
MVAKKSVKPKSLAKKTPKPKSLAKKLTKAQTLAKQKLVSDSNYRLAKHYDDQRHEMNRLRHMSVLGRLYTLMETSKKNRNIPVIPKSKRIESLRSKLPKINTKRF